MRQILLLLAFFVALFSPFAIGAQSEDTGCGYSIEVTAIDKHLIGKVLPPPGMPCGITKVRWYDAKSNALLQESIELDYYVSDYDSYRIRAVYEVVVGNGTFSCNGVLEQDLLLLEPGCYQPFPGTGSALCTNIFAPVCGCNGVTYYNECNAKAAGASTWWAGECASQPSSTTCGTTDLGIDVLYGNPADGYTVRFTNLASGNFTHIQLDFGDSCQIYQSPQWATKIHHFNKGGIYQTTLTAWNSNQPGCVSSISKFFVTDALSLTNATLPRDPDYVMPGDANGDGKANAYDLLYISKGYGKAGSPRPEASIDWAPQYAPNWPNQTIHGTNYKHLDSNGDGAVNEFDIAPLELHYQPIWPIPQTNFNAAAPKIFTRIQQDTLVVDASNPPTSIDINVDLMVGTPDNPVNGLYGLACALNYPEFTGHDPSMLYDPSFFGSSNYVLSLSHDEHSLLQYDVAFAHKSGVGTSGYGRVAEMKFKADFIIIIDIIDRSEAQMIPFVVKPEGIRAIDSIGQEMPLSPEVESDTLWIKLINQTSGTLESAQAQQVKLFPNPTHAGFEVQTGQLKVSGIEVFNALGQLVTAIQPAAGVVGTHIATEAWPEGIYSVHITTPAGTVQKQVTVK